MDAEHTLEWLTALRSGEYTQGMGHLRDEHNNMCCLGVLFDLEVKKGNGRWLPDPIKPGYYVAVDNDEQTNYPIGSASILPEETAKRLNIGVAGAHINGVQMMGSFSLAYLNDNGQDFNFIADVIERTAAFAGLIPQQKEETSG